MLAIRSLRELLEYSDNTNCVSYLIGEALSKVAWLDISTLPHLFVDFGNNSSNIIDLPHPNGSKDHNLEVILHLDYLLSLIDKKETDQF